MKNIRITIGLSSMLLDCSIGILSEELYLKQPIQVDVCVEISREEKLDDISLTLDYRAVKELVESYATKPHISLLESLAERIACKLMDFPDVIGVIVRIKKPMAFSDGSVPVIQASAGTLSEHVRPHW
jgi:dihydroneopterin aldolase